ncbi:MAG: LuxR C-terminal-related transcriptional regulator [Gammaproteobacteria bacterium]
MEGLAASPAELHALLEITSALTVDSEDTRALDGILWKIRALLPFERCRLMHETTASIFECTVPDGPKIRRSSSLSDYLESFERTETFQNAFFWRKSQDGVPCHGVAGLVQSDREPERASATLIELHFQREDLPPSSLFFVNIVVFYLHVCLVRRAGCALGREPQPDLTVKERDVLQWIASGKTSWEVGRILSISERTVKFHLRNIYAKLDVANRVQAAAKANRLRLVRP